MNRAAAPAARPDVEAVTVDGATVIHRGGHLHSLDPIATLVWRCCDGQATVEEIAADLAAVFAVPLDRARRDVATTVARLAGLDLLLAPDPEPPGAADVIADPPGSCASCADRDWALRLHLRVGDRIVDVGTDAPPVAAAIRSALGAHLVDAPDGSDASPPFLAVESPAGSPSPPFRPLHLLHRGDRMLARSRTVGDAVRGLAAYLAPLAGLRRERLAALDALVVTRGERALLVPESQQAGRLRRDLISAGARVSDVAVALVDAAHGEVVVGAPGLDIAEDALEPTAESVPWGRYRLDALGVAGPAEPAVALLTFAPARDDHRDHDANLRALAGLVASVPLVTVPDVSGIVARLG